MSPLLNPVMLLCPDARAQDQLDPKDVSLKVVPWLDVTVASTTVGWLRAVACNTRTSPQPVRVTKYRAIRRHSSPRREWLPVVDAR